MRLSRQEWWSVAILGILLCGGTSLPQLARAPGITTLGFHGEINDPPQACHLANGNEEYTIRDAQKDANPGSRERNRAGEAVTRKEVDEVIHCLLKSIPSEAEADTWRTFRKSLSVLATCEESRLAIPPLSKMLTDKNSEVACQAAYALGWLGEYAEAAVPALTQALATRSGFERPVIARALSSVGKGARPAAPALRWALQDPILPVRAWAARAIAKLEDPAKHALSVLRDCLLREKEEVYLQETMSALREIGSPAKIAIPELERVLRSSKASSALKQFAAETLIIIGGNQPEAVKVVLGVFRSADSSVGDWTSAAAALARVKEYEPEVRAAVQKMIQHGTIQEQCAFTDTIGLLPMSNKLKLQILGHALKDEHTRCRAAAVAGRLGAVAAPLLPQLRRLAHEKDPLLRLQAKVTIRAIERAVRLR